MNQMGSWDGSSKMKKNCRKLNNTVPFKAKCSCCPVINATQLYFTVHSMFQAVSTRLCIFVRMDMFAAPLLFLFTESAIMY